MGSQRIVRVVVKPVSTIKHDGSEITIHAARRLYEDGGRCTHPNDIRGHRDHRVDPYHCLPGPGRMGGLQEDTGAAGADRGQGERYGPRPMSKAEIRADPAVL